MDCLTTALSQREDQWASTCFMSTHDGALTLTQRARHVSAETNVILQSTGQEDSITPRRVKLADFAMSTVLVLAWSLRFPILIFFSRYRPGDPRTFEVLK